MTLKKCYMMAALRHLAITQVLGFSGYRLGSRVAVSGCRLQIMCCAYLLSQSRDFIHISGSQILRYLGCVVQGQDVRMRVSKGRVETKLKGNQVESTKQGRVDIQIVGTYMTQGTL